DGSFTDKLAEKIFSNSGGVSDLGLFNTFESIYDEIFEDYKKWITGFKDIGISPLHLAGSGPSVYFISDDESEVLEAAEKISSITNFRVYITRTVP
ncbi:MAG TPA: hypothetical protein VIK09_04790, partial [Candidatus Humimicrobiaceae bacterium]